jgi:hypothetical protein
VNSPARRVIAIMNTDPYMSRVTPISRTLKALAENSSDYSRGLP